MQGAEVRGALLRLVWQQQPCTEWQITNVIQQQRSLGRTTVLKTIQGVLGGSAEPLVAYLAGSEKLSAKDLETLRSICRKIDNKRRSQERPRVQRLVCVSNSAGAGDPLAVRCAGHSGRGRLLSAEAIGAGAPILVLADRRAQLLLMPWWIVAIPLPGFLGEDPKPVALAATRQTENHEGTLDTGIGRIVAPPAGAVELTASEAPGWFNVLGQLSWRSWLALAWFGGISWQFMRMPIQRRRLGRVLSRATPVTDARLLAAMEQAATELGLPQRPNLILTEEEGVTPHSFICRSVLIRWTGNRKSLPSTGFARAALSIRGARRGIHHEV